MTYFTVEEANALLPELEPRLERLQSAWQRLSRSRHRFIATCVKHPHDDFGGGWLGTVAADSITAENTLIGIIARGIVVRDPATGLVDFPAMRNGQEVQLCWRLGEPSVAHWHTVDGGFGARRRLDEDEG